jgi:hypothetical protein
MINGVVSGLGRPQFVLAHAEGQMKAKPAELELASVPPTGHEESRVLLFVVDVCGVVVMSGSKLQSRNCIQWI